MRKEKRERGDSVKDQKQTTWKSRRKTKIQKEKNEEEYKREMIELEILKVEQRGSNDGKNPVFKEKGRQKNTHAHINIRAYLKHTIIIQKALIRKVLISQCTIISKCIKYFST